MEETGFDRNLFESEIAELEQKVDMLSNFDQLIVFYGSSSIRLWESLKDDLAPLNVINLGFGGSSFGWCLHYYDRLIKKLPNASHFVFYGGDNDLESGLSPESVMRRFKRLINLTKNDFPTVKISVITIKPSPSRTYLQDKIKLTNSLIRKEIVTIPRSGQINIYDSMLDAEGVARPELFTDDELHMNEKGYKIWKGVVRKYFGV